MADKVRVRFAPSPTGPLHMGGVRTALYNYLFARKNGGDFLLRIEDTDQTRYVPGAEAYIIESLAWCGLETDEGPVQGGPYGPYRQSERKELYREYAERLVAEGNAYYAFDTPEELDDMRERLKNQGVPSPQYNHVTRQYMANSLTLPADEVQRRLDSGDPFVIRIKIPRGEEIKVNDIIRGWVAFQSSQLDDKVLFKSDGMPTYHLANVVDDYLMKITHVIRGEEWLPSTPTHVYLYRFLGWEAVMPEFAHLPLILKPDGKGKLSKRDGDRLGFPVFPLNWTDPETGEASVGYRERGFLPDAFVNMLAFLGWNPGTPEELFSGRDLIEAFSLERIGKSGARFDYDKARWFNQQYVKALPSQQLVDALQEELSARGIVKDREFLGKFAELYKDRITFVPDFLTEGACFFGDVTDYDTKVVKKKWSAERRVVFEEILNSLKALSDWQAPAIETTMKSIMEAHKLGFGDVFQPFRVMISGQAGGPPIFELAGLLGRETVVKRMESALPVFDREAGL